MQTTDSHTQLICYQLKEQLAHCRCWLCSKGCHKTHEGNRQCPKTSTSWPLLTIAQRILAQGKRIILNWVPIHIGIRGNELTDRLVENGRGKHPNPTTIYPSRKIFGHSSNAIDLATLLPLHREEARTSLSAGWYSNATGYMSHGHTLEQLTEVRAILHRIRLGYHCAGQIIKTTDFVYRWCKHYGEPKATLLHYLKSCEYTISETGITYHSW